MVVDFGTLWAGAGPLVGVALGHLFAMRQSRRDSRLMEVRSRRERLRTKVEAAYEDLEEKRDALTWALVAVTQTMHPGGAVSGNDRVPPDVTSLHVAHEAFRNSARRGSLYFAGSVADAVRSAHQAVLMAVHLATTEAGKSMGTSTEHPVRTSVAKALAALGELRDAIRADLLAIDDCD